MSCCGSPIKINSVLDGFRVTELNAIHWEISSIVCLRIDCADEKSDGENEMYSCVSSAYKWCLMIEEGGGSSHVGEDGLLREEINELNEVV